MGKGTTPNTLLKNMPIEIRERRAEKRKGRAEKKMFFIFIWPRVAIGAGVGYNESGKAVRRGEGNWAQE